MANDQNYGDAQSQFFSDVGTKLRDLEEKQRMLKDRLVLIGQNLVETKEKTTGDLLEIKKDIQTIKSTMDRMVSFIEMTSEELPKFARKEDLEILSKQAKMFQPLEFITKKDLKK